MLSLRFILRLAGLGIFHSNCNLCQIVMCRSTCIFSTVFRHRFKLFLFILLLIITIPWNRLRPSNSIKAIKLMHNQPFSRNEKIEIGLISCAGGLASTGRGSNETKAMNAAAEEPLTLIKSVLLSAKLSRAKRVGVHIFTDSWLLTETLKNTIAKFNSAMQDHIEMTVNFYNVFESVPRGFERDFVDNIRKCSYVRVFFPVSLPTTMKHILYLDTDVIITGNILDIWNNFKEAVYTAKVVKRPSQLAVMVPNSEVFGETYLDIYKINFGTIPHVPPRGVNSGVMFMNLEAMREFNWTERMMTIFKKRRSSIGGDQQLINILFHDFLNRLTLFPCQYNFQHLHCEKGMTCKNVTVDPDGIQIMHGAGGFFKQKGRSHNTLFTEFNKFVIDQHENVTERLYKPLVEFYSKPKSNLSVEGRDNCYGEIGTYLFKNLLRGNTNQEQDYSFN